MPESNEDIVCGAPASILVFFVTTSNDFDRQQYEGILFTDSRALASRGRYGRVEPSDRGGGQQLTHLHSSGAKPLSTLFSAF